MFKTEWPKHFVHTQFWIKQLIKESHCSCRCQALLVTCWCEEQTCWAFHNWKQETDASFFACIKIIDWQRNSETQTSISFVVELWWPNGLPSGAPYLYSFVFQNHVIKRSFSEMPLPFFRLKVSIRISVQWWSAFMNHFVPECKGCLV